MIVDPWGTILAEASGEQEEIIHAELDDQILQRVRSRIPISEGAKRKG